MAQPFYEYVPELKAVSVDAEVIPIDALAQQRKLRAMGAVASNDFKIYDEIIIRGKGQVIPQEYDDQFGDVASRPHFGLGSPYNL